MLLCLRVHPPGKWLNSSAKCRGDSHVHWVCVNTKAPVLGGGEVDTCIAMLVCDAAGYILQASACRHPPIPLPLFPKPYALTLEAA